MSIIVGHSRTWLQCDQCFNNSRRLEDRDEARRVAEEAHWSVDDSTGDVACPVCRGLPAERLAQGISVQLINPEWRWCDADRFDRTLERAIRFESMGATDIIVWYDEREDYMRIEFSLDGHRYTVQIYKVFRVEKDGWSDFVDSYCFPTEYAMFNFFEDGKHHDWVRKEQAKAA